MPLHWYLLIFLSLLGLWQIRISKDRYYAAGVFVLFVLCAEIIFSDVPGAIYYVVDSLCYFIIIVFLSKSQTTVITWPLLVVSFLAIIVNLVSWILFEFYYPPSFNDMSFIVIHLVAIYILGLPDNKRGAKMGIRSIMVFPFDLPRYRYCFKMPRKT